MMLAWTQSASGLFSVCVSPSFFSSPTLKRTSTRLLPVSIFVGTLDAHCLSCTSRCYGLERFVGILAVLGSSNGSCRCSSNEPCMHCTWHGIRQTSLAPSIKTNGATADVGRGRKRLERWERASVRVGRRVRKCAASVNDWLARGRARARQKSSDSSSLALPVQRWICIQPARFQQQWPWCLSRSALRGRTELRTNTVRAG
ncbi:uncharacterized protein J3D65DRAFT_617077 [Phyllosticta citribraziliensis]|uniref:Secreted protein n=1 Tax=Phyllosticta citribraziliensis TaxID=989973 RepID=A0ABR1M223_9PEZI